MSLGIHRVWKNEFVNSLGTIKPNIIYENGKERQEKLKIVDVAGGTGDISFRIWQRGQNFAKSYFSKYTKFNKNQLRLHYTFQ